MRKILSFKKLEDRIYILEYERDFLFFKKKYKKTLFRGITYWRDLYTGILLPYKIDSLLDSLSFYNKEI